MKKVIGNVIVDGFHQPCKLIEHNGKLYVKLFNYEYVLRKESYILHNNKRLKVV
jgi:hypothetical protein